MLAMTEGRPFDAATAVAANVNFFFSVSARISAMGIDEVFWHARGDYFDIFFVFLISTVIAIRI
jgi:hypothetical protein